MNSIHDKHDKEVKRLKEAYPALRLWFGVAAGCFISRTGYVELCEEVTINAKSEASATTLAVINALEKIELSAGEMIGALLKEYCRGEREDSDG